MRTDSGGKSKKRVSAAKIAKHLWRLLGEVSVYVMTSFVDVPSAPGSIEHASGHSYELGVGFRMDQKDASAFVASVVNKRTDANSPVRTP